MSILAFQRPSSYQQKTESSFLAGSFRAGAIFTGLSAGQRRDKLERLIGQYKTLPAREMSDAHQAAEAVMRTSSRALGNEIPPGAMSKGWSGLCLTLLTEMI